MKLVFSILLFLQTGFTALAVSRFTGPADSSRTAVTAPAAWQACYDSAGLHRYGLPARVFERAWTGCQRMTQRGLLSRPGILAVCDFSQSSARKRLYIIDLERQKLVLQTYVAHGQGSGDEFARRFSNEHNSHQSSLGFYATGGTYQGEHGYSLKLQGVEPGINDQAMSRAVVMHAAEYMSESYIRANGKAGRSWGCPAVPPAQHQKIINHLKNGACLFIYHPAPGYLKRSRMLN